ncbi:ABC transporter substrate-binding protein [Paenibacillaceae bacterium WGS1546]|uniref:ABC transporter substrate-binding protein n=1 Tax=Cohnella sp. WGS1546 TaxID=3366810 RepID=UPI00372D067A
MNNKASRIRKWVLPSLALSLLVPMLAACSSGSGANDPDNQRTLRIGTMYGSRDDESWFRQQFTDMFEFTHPNITIEVVPAIDYSEMQFEDRSQQQEPIDQLQKVKDIMTGTNPIDVMILDMYMLGQLANEGMLKQLDPLLREDKVDLEEFVPTVIDSIKDQGNGFIYALTPTFQPAALYYNKKIFTDSGVEMPTDGMSWDDVFNLAKRVKSGEGKDSIFGFSLSQWGAGDNFWEFQNFAAPLRLKMYDDQAETMTVNSPQWKNLWDNMAQMKKDRVTPSQEDMHFEDVGAGSEYRYNPFQGRLFFQGRVAMMVGHYGMINEIQQLNNNSDKLNMQKLDWDVVTMPYFPGQEGIGSNISLNQLSGINANAANPDDAWEFVKFMNGKDWAKLKSRSTHELSARKEFVKVRDGLSYNIEAFTKMKPVPPVDNMKEQALHREKPNLYLINEMGSMIFSQVMQGNKTAEEGLALWESKGNELLQKIKNNPSGNIEGALDGIIDGDMGNMSVEKMQVMRAAGVY